MAIATVPPNLPPRQPSRRALLRVAGGTATAVIAAPAGPAVADRDSGPDPHPAWFAEWQRLAEWCEGPGPGPRELQDCPEWHRCLELEELIGGTPARTLAGTLCQIRMLHWWCPAASLPNDACAAGLGNAIATLEQLAGGQAHV